MLRNLATSLSPWAASIAVASSSAAAWAAPCGEFVADDGDNVIVVGEWADDGLPFPGSNEIGVCWRDAGGTWRFQAIPTCRNTTSASSPLRIRGLGGDDVVVPVVREIWDQDFVCPSVDRTYLWPYHLWTGDYAEYADPPGCILPEGCPGAFDFGLWVEGGTGEDFLWGTPNADSMFSNRPHTLGWTGIVPPPADGESDALCGMGGSDNLFGDPTTTGGDGYKLQECFDGGVDQSRGADTCWGFDAQWDEYVVGSCESRHPAYPGYQVGEWYFDYNDGLCCTTSSTPGCQPGWDSDVQACVCEYDDYCCDTAWDSYCVWEVELFDCGQCSELHVVQSGCWDTCRHTASPELFPSSSFVVPPLRDIMADAGVSLDFAFRPQIRR